MAEISGTYGRGTPCTIFTHETRLGTWYVVQDSVNVNFTPEAVEDGVDVETLDDTDAFTASKPISFEDDLYEELRA